MIFILEKKTESILVEFALGKYMHIFPVTKFQFEKYLKDQCIKYKLAHLIDNMYIPQCIEGKNITKPFVRNITFEEARGFCKWVGGRLPTAEEWEIKYALDYEDIYLNALKFAKNNKDQVDNHIIDLLEKFCEYHITTNFYDYIGELTTLCDSQEYYSKIYLKDNICNRVEVIGDPPYKKRNKKFSFTYVLGD